MTTLKTKTPVILLISICLVLLVTIIQQLPSHGVDVYILYSAGKAVIAGANPYQMEMKFYSPAWMLALLTPMALLPLGIVRVLWMLASMTTWIAILHVAKIQPLNIALFLLNPFFVKGMLLGSYDWLCLIGVLMPAGLGAWFLLLKPQVALGYMFFQLRKIGLRRAIYAYIVPGLLLLSFVATSLSRTPILSDMWWNRSLGLWGVPIGLALMYVSFKEENPLFALAAAPFMSPYVGIQSWAVAFFAIVKNKYALGLAVIVSWIWFMVR